MRDIQVLDLEFEPRNRCYIIGTVLSAIAGPVIGSLFDRNTGRDSVSDQASRNIHMYRHRYQWQMEDMRRAGLNPILSYRQGAPGVPGVGGYSSNVAGALASGVQSAIALKRLNAEIKNIHADTRLKTEQRTVATTAHQLNDTMAALNAQLYRTRDPEAYSAQQLMRLMRSGGDAGDLAAAINRLRLMLGIGGGR